MCYVTITELRNNLSYYLTKATEEDVFVTKNGEVIVCLTNPKLKSLMELDGVLSSIDFQTSEVKDDEALFNELNKKNLKSENAN